MNLAGADISSTRDQAPLARRASRRDYWRPTPKRCGIVGTQRQTRTNDPHHVKVVL